MMNLVILVIFKKFIILLNLVILAILLNLLIVKNLRILVIFVNKGILVIPRNIFNLLIWWF